MTDPERNPPDDDADEPFLVDLSGNLIAFRQPAAESGNVQNVSGSANGAKSPKDKHEGRPLAEILAVFRRVEELEKARGSRFTLPEAMAEVEKSRTPPHE